MKIVLTIAFLAAIVYGVFRFSASLIVGSYESIEYGIKFNYPSSLVVNERADKDTLEISKVGKNVTSLVFFRKFKHDLSSELSYRLPDEFGKEMLNESHMIYNRVNGISFQWQGAKGLESAFAFEAGDRDYVLSTFGMPDKDIEAQFTMIAKSLFVTYE